MEVCLAQLGVEFRADYYHDIDMIRYESNFITNCQV